MQIVNQMTPNPTVIEGDDKLANAKALMDDGRLRRLPVMEAGRLVGILTERDIREQMGYLGSTRVNAAVRTPLVTITPYDTVKDAARLMLKHKVGDLPIVFDGRLMGIVTARDFLEGVAGRRHGN